MSLQRQQQERILSDVSYPFGSITSYETDGEEEGFRHFSVGDQEELTLSETVDILSNRPSRLVEYINNPGTVVFLYPIFVNQRDDDKEVLEPVHYLLSSFPDEATILGAINTFYDQNMIPDVNPVLKNIITSNTDIVDGTVRNNRMYGARVLLGAPRSFAILPGRPIFGGLSMIYPGVYRVEFDYA